MTDIEELVIDWYKARRVYFSNEHDEKYLPSLFNIEMKLEMFALSVISPIEYAKLAEKYKVQ